jgi:alpha-beta hydrolase superfamily lysophospholipase
MKIIGPEDYDNILPPPPRRRKHLFRTPKDGVGYAAKPLKWKRYVLLVIVIALFACAIVIAGISAYAGNAAIRIGAVDIPPININMAVDFSSVNFKSIYGAATLRGWLFKAPSSKSIVIMVHGMGENRFQYGSDTLEVVSTFIDGGFSVLAFDMRSAGGAESGMFTYGLEEMNDVLGAINYVREQKYENIIVYGFSTGANAAVMASANPVAATGASTVITQEFLDGLSNSVNALILDTPITDIRGFIMHVLSDKGFELPDIPFKYTIPFAANLFINGEVQSVDVGENLSHFVPRPVLILHGGKDAIVAEQGLDELYESYSGAAAGKISIWSDPDAGYMESYNNSRQEYLESISNFLEINFSFLFVE